ncbi:MAG: MotA/TolQ/ExbB proton channel family protein [Kiritimatiellae bacterium]|jgi:biopolymer transport protein ExbB|nr:MotA/TolQ/ExbB proton channel family protein [Kiritimatiellia bacterium]MDD2348226.1 MotA/TolQ/ExbB proton channel family protein [Kiritimatiellia bacterium]MDD3585180.1 MotA/TolQ/ExbB proton channel family protein [Kiritimatiellia bacterium]HHU16189.1 MotA/TolQ/ExbB proton channel family protein [Lentisphaerota bacterium]HON47939.1 MotA/TolQ/ExbB proton channel family protein [Kiritimatiellia bacterium]
MMGQGGPVFLLIVALGIASVIVFFERLLHLRRAQIDYNDFLKGVCNVLENGHIDEAMMICEETPGPVAAVTLTAIRHRQSSHEALREAVDNTGRAEMSRLERRLASLAVICQIAPLLGLLGTLLGVIRIVQTMNEQAPVVQSTDLTAGLMQALVATVAGLLVAVPCHVMYTMLMVRIERIVLDMEACASEIVAYIMKLEHPTS